jgi:hypothetical protein
MPFPPLTPSRRLNSGQTWCILSFLDEEEGGDDGATQNRMEATLSDLQHFAERWAVGRQKVHCPVLSVPS